MSVKICVNLSDGKDVYTFVVEPCDESWDIVVSNEAAPVTLVYSFNFSQSINSGYLAFI